MARRVFLSYQHRDHGRAKGFDLVRRSPNVSAEYSVRHLLNPVDSTDHAYIGRRIRDQLKHTSVTVVLIGRETARSDWVGREIDWSLSKAPANGLLGIIIDPQAQLPEGLKRYGAEVIDWTKPSDVKTFEDAIDRAALRAHRAPAITSSAGETHGPSSCGRT